MMTINIARLSILQKKIKSTDIKNYVINKKCHKPLQNLFRPSCKYKNLTVIHLLGVLQLFSIFVSVTQAQMEGNYSEPACQEFLEPVNPDELKLLRECAKQQREAKIKRRKDEIKALRNASASVLSESMGGPAGEIVPVTETIDGKTPAEGQ
jgi:hypothetical protein